MSQFLEGDAHLLHIQNTQSHLRSKQKDILWQKKKKKKLFHGLFFSSEYLIYTKFLQEREIKLTPHTWSLLLTSLHKHPLPPHTHTQFLNEYCFHFVNTKAKDQPNQVTYLMSHKEQTEGLKFRSRALSNSTIPILFSSINYNGH
jgi:hypothetical protein